MGNCYNEHNMQDDNMIETSTFKPRKFKPLKVLDQVRNIPPISKKIMNRLQGLQPFFKIKPSLSNRIYKVQNDAVYEGSLKKIKQQRFFEGPGRLMLSDGTLIQSEFHDGKPFHLTRIFKTNGDYFEGYLENTPEKSYGKVCQGTITFEGGIWDSKPNGKGKQYSSKYHFEGIYKNGKKVRGKLRWNFEDSKNLYSYEGQFEDDQFSGQGVLIDKQGKYKGMFKNGKKHGKGEWVLKNNKKQVGKFENGFFVPETNSTQDDPKGIQLPSNHLTKSNCK